MVSRIVYLVAWPVDEWDAERYGFETLRSSGLAVEVLDMSRLFHATEIQAHPVPDALHANWIHVVANFAELGSRIAALQGDSLFVDYFNGLSPPGWQSLKVLRLLHRCKARYFVVSAGALPTPPRRSGWARLRSLVRKVLNPRSLAAAAARRVVALYGRAAGLYGPPVAVFGGDSEVVQAYVKRHALDAGRVVPIHSLDHDTYLRYRRNTPQPPRSEPTCVFLDDGITRHPDLAIGRLPGWDETSYFAVLERFFEAIESKWNLRVVVAVHPRVSYDDNPRAFGGREMVKGKTIDLVAHSALVATHASTSVSFAVLFDKPLLFVRHPQLARAGIDLWLDTMARALGCPVADLDRAGWAEALPDYRAWPRTLYKQYKYRYIASPAAEQLTVWEAVARHARHKLAA